MKKKPKLYARENPVPMYESDAISPDVKMPPKDKDNLILAVLFALAFTVLFACVTIAAVRGLVSVSKENKIEQAIIEELKLQATDYGVDGDEYVIFLFPATSAYTEVTEEGGRLYLAYIIGSGTDDEGEWQLVKWEPNGNISTFDIP